MAEEKRTNLGRGLAALLGEDAADYAELDKGRTSRTVPIDFSSSDRATGSARPGAEP